MENKITKKKVIIWEKLNFPTKEYETIFLAYFVNFIHLFLSICILTQTSKCQQRELFTVSAAKIEELVQNVALYVRLSSAI